ncbi:MAG: type IX secretion system outer membrane channel protein PorV [Bacteroidales bacterium]|nr:type IX secretion system outer membrane channel protein PorV [Bacteroidales bacterium]
MKNFCIKTLLVLLAITALILPKATAQDEPNVINTGVPFLTISPDARGGGMGDVGVSTSADAASLYWNSAKYAFLENKGGFQVSYIPWLTELANDIGLSSVYGYYKLDDRQAIAASLRYFSIGKINFTNEDGHSLGTYRPNEFAIDVTYSRKFSEKISGAVAARYIRSNLTAGYDGNGQNLKPGNTGAADIAFLYREPFENVLNGSTLGVGATITNIGAKIAYTGGGAEEKAFLPTTLRFGPSFEMNFDDHNSLTVALEASKLLVPTQPVRDSAGNIVEGKDPNVSVVKGMIQSFYDAPNGFSEEWKEWMYSVAVEYYYHLNPGEKLFGARAGYFHESPMKGNRQYLTFGISLTYNVFDLGVSYLVPTSFGKNITSSTISPQDNTLRFSLTFNFGK